MPGTVRPTAFSTLVFCLLVGTFISGLRGAARSGNILALPFYCALLVQVALMPIFSALYSAVGIYTDIMLLGFWLFSSYWCARTQTASDLAHAR